MSGQEEPCAPAPHQRLIALVLAVELELVRWSQTVPRHEVVRSVYMKLADWEKEVATRPEVLGEMLAEASLLPYGEVVAFLQRREAEIAGELLDVREFVTAVVLDLFDTPGALEREVAGWLL